MAVKPFWQCPVCNRRFAKRNQWHSCRPVTIESHFAGKPAPMKALFEALCAKLQAFGPLRTDAVKSSINLVSNHHLGGVRVLRDGLRIGFVLSRPLDHARVLRTERIGLSIYAHHVKITRPEDLDRELLGWLKEAYQRSKG